MAVYTVSFGRVRNNVAATYDIYTAPSGVTSVLRNLVLFSSAAGSHARVGIFDGTLVYTVLEVGSSSATTTTPLDTRIVMQVGDTLRLILFDALSTWSLQAAGYQLQ